MPRRAARAAVLLGVFLLSASCQLQKDVPFVATPEDIVARMLDLGEVTPADVVYDLGSGDGRIVIAAARNYGARGVGIEIDPVLVALAREKARQQGVAHLVSIRQQDVLDADISQATVVTLYLNPTLNMMLRPKLWGQLRPGSRVVSHDFKIKGWAEDARQVVMGSHGKNVTLYLWRVSEADADRIVPEEE